LRSGIRATDESQERGVVGETIKGTARFIDEMAFSYGLSSIEGWRWIKQGESPAVATLSAGGHRFVARLFGDETAVPQADYISQLGLHLGSVGVEAEEVVRAASGEPFARLPSGVPVILSRFYPDPPMPVPFEAERARVWGRYVSGLHNACRDWHRPSVLPSSWLRQEPRMVIERSLALTAHSRGPRGILVNASEHIIHCWEGATATQPVHGDLWPGNLLSGPHGLRAIDFADAGDGPRTIDLATAFRWMPWRDDPSGAARSWEEWLAGYSEVGTLSQAELDAVPPLACLQHLIWMTIEVDASNDAVELSRYVEDHCSAIHALLAAS